MRIKLASIPVVDQEKALQFYTGILGFEKKQDFPLGNGARWLTVVSPQDPDGVELVLEPNGAYPAMKVLKSALVKDNLPFTAFQVDDIRIEHERLKSLGVLFTQEPTQIGPTIQAIFDDTCGNLIQMYQI